jgi:tRNA A-37 threonylcarbamoyl transferase component Bud32/TolB-like protein
MNPTEHLQRALGEGFRIERELGGGGMSRVFLARELSLDRQVVVKVLSPEASAGVSADRFRRETQLIAKLQHPNVVPLLSAGEADGMLYYVMPYVAGDSLRARMSRDGALPLGDVVRVLREVLDTLAFAHQHGVIHRDIKPENILLAAGHAVVADFGIAKALRDSAALTATGISVGTPAYMAPEQAAGDPLLDHRADLYAVGVVAYEMLSGAPLFTGSVQQVVTAHMTQAPAPVTQRRSDVPAPLAALVMRALEKDAARRPQSAAEMLAVVDAVATPGGTDVGLSAARRSRFTAARALGVALPLAAVAAFAAWRYSRPAVMTSAQSIAIVPFSVDASDTALTRLAQNLATLVGNSLDGIGEIRAADPTSVLSHAHGKGAALSAPDAIAIAKALGAKSAVHGTMVRTGALVQIDASMYDLLAPETAIARMTVRATPDSIVAITDSITMKLLQQVWSRGIPPTPHVASITSHSPVALREFLNGERLWARGEAHAAGDAFKRAVYADTTFWFAAYRYATARSWWAEPIEDTSITQRMTRHRADLPERERALLATRDSSPSQSEYMRRLKALTLRYPDYAPAWQTLADNAVHHAERAGHSVRDAIGMWREVQRLMPNDPPTTEHLAITCLSAGDLECARAASARFDTLIRAEPSPSKMNLYTQQSLALHLVPMTPARLDSLIRVGLRDSTLTMFTRTGLVVGAPALVWQPGLFDYLDSATRHVIAVAPKTVIGPSEVAGWLQTRAARGDWAALDSAIRMGIQETNNAFRTSPIDLIRGRVVAELTGAMTPAASTVERLAERADDPNRSAATRAEARWLIAANALARGDSAVFRAQVAAVSGDTTPFGRIATRSLRGLALGLGGNRRAAAESLLAVEREHGERGPKVWGAFAADRLFGSQWLTESKRYAPADSLLEFTRGYIIWSTASAAWPVFAAAQLQRSRIAEAMGNREEAIRYATIFIRAYDLSPEKHREVLDEAQQRIARLGGKIDVRRSVVP